MMINKLYIILIPVFLILGLGLLIDIIGGGKGYFFAMGALPLSMIWLGLSSVFLVIYNSFKLKKFVYIGFSIFALAVVFILFFVGLEELLFSELIVYLLGLIAIKFFYYKNKS